MTSSDGAITDPGHVVKVSPQWNLVYLSRDQGDTEPYPFPLHRLLAAQPQLSGGLPLIGTAFRLHADGNRLLRIFSADGVQILPKDPAPAGDADSQDSAIEHLLDPRTAQEVDGMRRVRMPGAGLYPELRSQTISDRVREFGFLVDDERLLPGDLLLFAPIQPTWDEKALIHFQRKAFPEKHAKWVHAAVYTGPHQTCEATLQRGTHASSLFPRVHKEGYLIKARRVPALTGCAGHQISIEALRGIPTRYALWLVLLQSVKSRSSMKLLDAWRKTRAHQQQIEQEGKLAQARGRESEEARVWTRRQGLTCSDVFVKAANGGKSGDGSGTRLSGLQDELTLCPALLSEVPSLNNVLDLAWVKIDENLAE